VSHTAHTAHTAHEISQQQEHAQCGKTSYIAACLPAQRAQ
jgi:hypothetical protein